MSTSSSCAVLAPPPSTSRFDTAPLSQVFIVLSESAPSSSHVWRQIHECVFAVLTIESEPIDPRPLARFLSRRFFYQ
ncbi:hypothetical protein FJ419_18980 [Mesorhizobium sp. B2-6-2]|nr:hypothetical protein FJ419_18980 [Mesorhizobium sp. B2-6-2]